MDFKLSQLIYYTQQLEMSLDFWKEKKNSVMMNRERVCQCSILPKGVVLPTNNTENMLAKIGTCKGWPLKGEILHPMLLPRKIHWFLFVHWWEEVNIAFSVYSKHVHI